MRVKQKRGNMTTVDYTDELQLKAAGALAYEFGSRFKQEISDEIIAPLRNSLEKVKGFYENILIESTVKQDQTIEILKDRLLSHEAIKTELRQEVERLKEKLKTALQDKDDAQAREGEAMREKIQAEELNQALINEKMQLEKMLTGRGGSSNVIDELKLKIQTLQSRLTEAVNLAEAALEEKTAADKRADLALLIADEAEKKFYEANKSNETLNTQLNFYTQELTTAVTLSESFFSKKTQLEKKLTEFQEQWQKHLANSQDKP